MPIRSDSSPSQGPSAAGPRPSPMDRSACTAPPTSSLRSRRGSWRSNRRSPPSGWLSPRAPPSPEQPTRLARDAPALGRARPAVLFVTAQRPLLVSNGYVLFDSNVLEPRRLPGSPTLGKLENHG